MPSIELIEIHSLLVNALWRQILKEFPREAGALLYGEAEDRIMRISHVRLLENQAWDLNTLSTSLDLHNQPIGLFHAHRQDASPSPGDLSKMKNDSLLWVIARSGHPPSGRKFILKAYQWMDGEAIEIEVKETKS